jgi:hypothetical protein
MAQKVATDEAVFAAADALLCEGVPPTLKLLQERTGGSYTTVNKAFGAWKERRKTEKAQEPAPPEVAAKADQFGRALWHLAKQQADLAVQDVRRICTADLDAARRELVHAQEQIEALEIDRAVLTSQLQQAQSSGERERAFAQSQAKRLVDVEVELAHCKDALEQTREQASNHVLRASVLEGRCEALAKQLGDLLRALPGSGFTHLACSGTPTLDQHPD